MGAFCCFALKWHTGSISQHAPSPVQPFGAKRSMVCTPCWAFLQGLSGQISSWHPSRVVLLCMWLAIQTETVTPGTLLAELFCTGCPGSAWYGYIPKADAGAWVNQLACTGALAKGLILHLCNHLTQDRDLPTGPVASHWWPYSSPADHPPPGPWHTGHSCTLQWDFLGPWGWPPTWLTLLLQWFSVGCLRCQACTYGPVHTQKGIHFNVGLPHLYNIIGSCNWQGWPPSEWLTASSFTVVKMYMSGDCCWYEHVKNQPIEVLMELLWPQPT